MTNNFSLLTDIRYHFLDKDIIPSNYQATSGWEFLGRTSYGQRSKCEEIVMIADQVLEEANE